MSEFQTISHSQFNTTLEKLSFENEVEIIDLSVNQIC
jgi:hypothetical protein